MEALVEVVVGREVPLLVAQGTPPQHLHHKETMAVVGREDLLAAVEAVLALLVQAQLLVLALIAL
jgi:hypothetical protein